jgi:TusA-related sulfurtransferase
MDAVQFDQLLDTSGLQCPMPIVKARAALGTLAVGATLKVLSTDRGSVKDFQGWAKAARNLELVAQTTENKDGKDIYVHFVKRTA